MRHKHWREPNGNAVSVEKFPVFFPVNGNSDTGEQFALDCIHRHKINIINHLSDQVARRRCRYLVQRLYFVCLIIAGDPLCLQTSGLSVDGPGSLGLGVSGESCGWAGGSSVFG